MNNLIEQTATDRKLTVSEFAARMKKKYPAYKDMDDTELVNKIITKYPIYKNYIDFQQDAVAKQNPAQPVVPEEWKKFPCVTSKKDFQNSIDLYGKYSYTSSSPEYGEVMLSPDGSFTSTKGTKFNSGKWSCTASGKIYVEGSEPEAVAVKPTPVVNKPKLMHYVACTKLPCKFGTKNEKIREIQTCIGFPVKYQTGNFGPITRKGLMDLQIDVTNGITDQIYNDIMASCGSSPNPEPPKIIPFAEPEKQPPSDRISET